MADEPIQVVLTDRAKADYGLSLNAAVACIAGKEKDKTPLLHFGRVRNILRSLKDPDAAKLDQPMINQFAWMLTRHEGSTYVYYGRNWQTSTLIVIHLCEGSTDIYTLIAEVVFSGNTELLTELGITPPPLPPNHSIAIQ